MKSATEPQTASSFADPDLPVEADLSRAVRGKNGRRLVMQIMRYRQALQAIRDTPGVDDAPAEAARMMQEYAHQALTKRQSAD